MPVSPALENNHIRLLIADSTRMSSQLLAGALERHLAFEIVHVCATAAEGLNAADVYKPDIALLSVNLEDQPLKGLETARQLRSAHPECSIVLLVDNSRPDVIVGAFAAGVRGVFCRSESIETLIKCIHNVSCGQVWANSREIGFLLDVFVDTAPAHFVDAKGSAILSKREEDVVRCVAEGLTNRGVAERLRLSEHTVKNYIFRIFDKLGVSTRVELVLYAFSQRSSLQAQGRKKDELCNDQPSELEYSRARAEEGDCLAQLRLAQIHRQDTDGAPDKLSAATWLALAEKIGAAVSQTANSLLGEVIGNMTSEEISQIKTRVRQWTALHRETLADVLVNVHVRQYHAPTKRSGGGASDRYLLRPPRRISLRQSGTAS